LRHAAGGRSGYNREYSDIGFIILAIRSGAVSPMKALTVSASAKYSGRWG
jgi:hypothetical protein